MILQKVVKSRNRDVFQYLLEDDQNFSLAELLNYSKRILELAKLSMIGGIYTLYRDSRVSRWLRANPRGT